MTPSKWRPSTSLVGSLDGEDGGISDWRLWRALKDFFATAPGIVEEGSPALAEKLRRSALHWLRHTHATHLLEGGAEFTTVRDNRRHSSLAATSMYLVADDARRAKQLAAPQKVSEMSRSAGSRPYRSPTRARRVGSEAAAAVCRSRSMGLLRWKVVCSYAG